MSTYCPPPSNVEFTFEEKMRFDYLYRRWGKDWQKIASGLGTRTAIDVKRFWLKKSVREKKLQDVCSRISLPTTTYAKNEGTKITISSMSPFLWKLSPVEGQTKSFENLELLAHAAAIVSNN